MKRLTSSKHDAVPTRVIRTAAFALALGFATLITGLATPSTDLLLPSFGGILTSRISTIAAPGVSTHSDAKSCVWKLRESILLTVVVVFIQSDGLGVALGVAVKRTRQRVAV